MKKELIDKLFDEIENNKEGIRRTLYRLVNTILIEASDNYGKLTLTIKYERNDNNETNNNN